ncbi:NepR family anti-sigma factor [Limoniibacter endophyticus]|nr:NepR family anti-sigma factor [Limoniibacter endophyticus]
MSNKTENTTPVFPPAEHTKDALGANSEVARKLKQYYDELVTEEIPDRFADLLNQLEKVEMTKAKG